MAKKSVPEIGKIYKHAQFALHGGSEKMHVVLPNGKYDTAAVSHLKRIFKAKGLMKMWEDKMEKSIVISGYSYEPRGPILLHEEDRLSTLNLYMAPVWDSPQAVRPTELPTLFANHLEHLVPDTDARQYLLDWCAASLRGRCPTALGLVGEAQGTGKGLWQDVMARVHGHSNVSFCRDDVFKKEFNGFAAERTLVIFDEFKLNRNHAGAFKAMFGETLSIENKGQDIRSVPNHANFMFSTNSIRDVFLENGDRRMSIIETTETPLRDFMTAEECQKLVNHLSNPQNIAQLGLYLRYVHEIKNNMVSPYQGRLALDMVSAQMPAWQEAILRWAKENPGATLANEQITEMLQNRLPSGSPAVKPRTVYGACKQHLILKGAVAAKAVARNGFYSITATGVAATEAAHAETKAIEPEVVQAAPTAPAIHENPANAQEIEEMLTEPAEIQERTIKQAKDYEAGLIAALAQQGIVVTADARHPHDPLGRTVAQLALSCADFEASRQL